MSKKILIAEDEELICLLLKRSFKCFQSLGVDILIARNGEQALELAIKEKPDLIFLDIMMPKINGFDVCKKLKNDPELKNIYIIFLTAKGQYFDKEEGFKSGANEYLTKPMDPEDLINKVERILDIKVE